MAGVLMRPKPPGSRRSSAKHVPAVSPTAEKASTTSPSLLPSPKLSAPVRRASSNTSDISSNGVELEPDLGLELSSDLTAALEKSMQRRPSMRRASNQSDSNGRQYSRSFDDVNDENTPRTAHERLGVRLRNRRSGEALRELHQQYEASGQEDEQATPQSEPFFEKPTAQVPQSEVAEEDRGSTTVEPAENEQLEGETTIDGTTTVHRASDSMDSNLSASSEYSLDADWVGDLPREELEKLLFESRQIIKERERDLGIAAAIGKALLEKNISLRNRHEGIVSRFSSLNSMERMIVSQGEEAVDTPLPRYSPPHSDIALSTHGGDEGEDTTPRPDSQMTSSGSGYFQGLQASPTAVRLARICPTSATIDERHILEPSSTLDDDDATSSPARSRFESETDSPRDERTLPILHHLPASETHRRLEMIVQQNDTLLEQIGQLQAESEEAKRDGGRRQKKLIREIDSLRTELEIAEARTLELEQHAEAQKGAQESSGGDQPKRKQWRRRGTMPWEATPSSDLPGAGAFPSHDHNEDSDDVAISEYKTDAEAYNSDAQSLSGQSTTSARPSQLDTQTASERAIVSQLMTKVRELEDINSALIRDAHERDGRIGRFLEDSERLRDMYDAVESEAVSTLTAAASVHDLSSASVYSENESPCTSAAASPAASKTRGAGNRYLIGGRRTLRAAMQKRVEDDGSHYVSSSNSSSAQSSPQQQRRSKRAMRPRILITPSCEDLQAKSRSDQLAGWREDASTSPVVKETRRRRLRTASSESFSGDRAAVDRSMSSDDTVMMNGMGSGTLPRRFSADMDSSSPRGPYRSLGSELEGVFDESLDPSLLDDTPQQDTSVPTVSTVARTVRKASSQVSLRAFSEAGSDIADLKWSNSSTFTLPSEDALADMENLGSLSPMSKQLALISPSPPRQQHALATLHESDDGDWFSVAAHDLIPKGSLKNDVETSHENYSLIEKLTSHVPVHWADDEDFGKPITEREARQMGLLEGPATSKRSSKTRGVLSWIAPRIIKDKIETKGKRRDTSSVSRQLESSEDVERRAGLERILRAKRIAALHDRVLAGQMSEQEAREKGAFDDGDADTGGQSRYDFEAEVTQRAFAYRTVRRRDGRAAQPASTSQSPSRRRTVDVRDVRKAEQTHGEETFELVDVDASKRRQGQRGTDYYPVTLRERYRPTVVKQRVHQFSTETITWAMAWATFSIVMVFAFVAAFARGPKRILHGQAN